MAANFKEHQPTLPYPYEYSTIGPEGLNFRIRNGNGCFPLGMSTPNDCEICNELSKTLKSNLLTRSQMGCGEDASPRFRGNSEASAERHRGRAPLEKRAQHVFGNAVFPPRYEHSKSYYLLVSDLSCRIPQNYRREFCGCL